MSCNAPKTSWTKSASPCREPTRRELELVDKVQQAVDQLTDLSTKMEQLRSRTKGSAAKVLAQIGFEITSLAEMLSNQTCDEQDESF